MQEHHITITRKYNSKSGWNELAHCLAGDPNYLSIGDCITDKLKDDREFTVEVVALSPYSTNTAAFVFKDCICNYKMNANDTNVGGWKESLMRAWLNTEFYKLLPDDLQNVIKSRMVQQKQNGEIISSVDRLWLPSHTEVFGGEMESDVDDVQFEWFKNRKNRIKTYADGTSAYWWERSPYYYNSFDFCYVITYGSAIYDFASGSIGVAPAFII